MSATPAPRRKLDPLGKFPESVKAAYAKFQQTGDASALDEVVMAVVRDFIPKTHPLPPGPLPETSKLMPDLGFDSLALSEMIFFLEDLFGVRISNEEIMSVRSVSELRQFLRKKLASLPGAAR
jgi:acyl carrier protein